MTCFIYGAIFIFASLNYAYHIALNLILLKNQHLSSRCKVCICTVAYFKSYTLTGVIKTQRGHFQPVVLAKPIEFF